MGCAELKELSFLGFTRRPDGLYQTSATDSCNAIAGHDGGIAVSATKACSFSCNQCGVNQVRKTPSWLRSWANCSLF